MHAFNAFVLYKHSIGETITNADWKLLTKKEFDDFRVSPTFLAGHPGTTVPIPATSASISTQQPKAKDPVLEFKRGIKRDINLFSAIKEDKQWDAWQRATIAQACAQDVSEILDSNYVPAPADANLFDEKQKYMFAVFERNLLTDQGKALVRDYADKYDAQSIYRDLSAYALHSTKAALDSSNMLSYITSVRLGDGSWRGSTHAFILHWQDQVRKYETLVDPGDHFSDGQKPTMLENTVHPVSELRVVKTQAAQHKTQTGRDLTYREYTQLLLSAAAQFDAQFTTKSSAAKSASKRRTVYEHDVQEATEVDDDVFFDIDSDLNTIHAYNSITRNKAFNYPRLTSDQWHRLSSEAQANWDKFTPAEKTVILEERSKKTFGTNPNRPTHTPRPCQSHLHDMSAYDFLTANLHDLCMGSSDDGTMAHSDMADDHTPDTEDNGTEGTTLLAHATKTAANTSPGDLQRVLSNSMAKYSGKKTSTAKPSTNDGEITVNGKKYRQVNMAKLMYIASAH